MDRYGGCRSGHLLLPIRRLPRHDPQPRQKSNAHFRKAVTRLPLGVSSNFRYWGEDKTIYVGSAQGRAAQGHRRQRVHRLPHGLRPLHPRLCRSARRRGARGQASSRRRVCARRTEREYAVAERISQMVPAAELVRFSNSGTEAVMAALRARARLHRQGLLRRGRGRLSRRVRRRALVHADRGLGALVDGEPHLVPYSAGVPGMLRGAAPRGRR